MLRGSKGLGVRGWNSEFRIQNSEDRRRKIRNAVGRVKWMRGNIKGIGDRSLNNVITYLNVENKRYCEECNS